MAITTLDQYIAATKQRITFFKPNLAALASTPFSTIDAAGAPGSGTLAGTSTGAGVVPTDVTAGCPLINAFSGVGYLSKVEFGNDRAARFSIHDMLFKAGAYAYTAGTTTLSAQPAFSGRVPTYTGGASWGQGLEIWLEVSTAFVTGTAWSVQVTYTNQDGTTGRTTPAFTALAAAALIKNRMLQLALQSGDSGVQKIESVIVTNGGTAMTAGAFNVLVLRPLWTCGRIPTGNAGDIHDMLKTGMPIVYQDSALIFLNQPDSTFTGLAELQLEIASA